MFNKKWVAIASMAMALTVPVSAHAGLSEDLSKATAGWKQKASATFEWLMLNSPTYLVWKSVTLPNAACGDGSPYRFFINQSPTAKHTVLFFEGGGACWDADSCAGRGEMTNASNPNGIGRDYMVSTVMGAAQGAIAEPMINRLRMDSATPTRGMDWNHVFIPYCSGDVFVGNHIKHYDALPGKPDSVPRTQYFKGHANTLALADWLAAQKKHPFLAPVANPQTLLVAGQSAGGFGATYNYSWMRTRLNPSQQSGLFNDSGWVMDLPSPRTSSSKYRGIALKAFDDWNVGGASGLLTRYENEFKIRLADRENVGEMPLALSAQFPRDRFIHAAFFADRVLPRFANSLLGGPLWSDAEMLVTHEAEIRKQLLRYEGLPNVGYYIPFGRDLAYSHVLSLLTFEGTRVIPQYGPRYDNVNVAILSALHRTPEPIRAVDASREIQSSVVGMLINMINPDLIR